MTNQPFMPITLRTLVYDYPWYNKMNCLSEVDSQDFFMLKAIQTLLSASTPFALVGQWPTTPEEKETHNIPHTHHTHMQTAHKHTHHIHLPHIHITYTHNTHIHIHTAVHTHTLHKFTHMHTQHTHACAHT